jgi:hypothetical protein
VDGQQWHESKERTVGLLRNQKLYQSDSGSSKEVGELCEGEEGAEREGERASLRRRLPRKNDIGGMERRARLAAGGYFRFFVGGLFWLASVRYVSWSLARQIAHRAGG